MTSGPGVYCHAQIVDLIFFYRERGVFQDLVINDIIFFSY